jgi:Tol biopolymer transport system component
LLKRIVFFLLFLYPLIAYAEKSSGHIRSLAICPDGTLIAIDFGKDNESFIYLIRADTGVASRLTTAKTGAESGPAFSPDGRRIAYSYSPGNGAHSSIIIRNIDGSDLHSWSSSEGNDYWPVFSPDNKTIIFARSGYFGNYSPIAQPHPHAWRFYASNLDGTNVRELTNESFYSASPPSVSPDGKNIVMATEGLDTPGQIAVYSIENPGKLLLSLRPHVPREADRKDPIFNCPEFMADRKSILFMAASNGKPWSGYDYDIYRVDIATGALGRLTNGNGFASDLRVSADGKTAVFLKWHSDWRKTPVKNELYLLDLQTRTLRLVKVSGVN